uniref:CUB domain-containing protein n=1 Tax=Rhabditophanes sp. KR3021 TaxID=114890 RepID=A0AC35U0H7_9BILA
SDGKEFAFIDDGDHGSDAIITNIVAIPIYNDSICTFKYTKTSDDAVVSIKKTAVYGNINKIVIKNGEAVLVTEYDGLGIFNDAIAKDFRIFVSCTEEVKLIARIVDPLSIYFDTASTWDGQRGSIAILPINQGGSITVNIVGYLDGELLANNYIRYNIGQNQRYMTAQRTYDTFKKTNVTMVITVSSPIMISYDAKDISASD